MYGGTYGSLVDADYNLERNGLWLVSLYVLGFDHRFWLYFPLVLIALMLERLWHTGTYEGKVVIYKTL